MYETRLTIDTQCLSVTIGGLLEKVVDKICFNFSSNPLDKKRLLSSRVWFWVIEK